VARRRGWPERGQAMAARRWRGGTAVRVAGACAGEGVGGCDGVGGRDGDSAGAGGGSFSSTDGDAGAGDGNGASLPPVLGLKLPHLRLRRQIENGEGQGRCAFI
jgi:hypothetical protein